MVIWRVPPIRATSGSPAFTNAVLSSATMTALANPASEVTSTWVKGPVGKARMLSFVAFPPVVLTVAAVSDP